MTHRTDHHLNVREYGGADGHPVVLLHPLATSGELWQQFGTWLGRDGRTVLAPDLPPDGDSAEVTIDLMADAVAADLDRRGGAAADVVGMSMGGCVALTLALRRPDLVRRLVLADTTASYGPDRVAKWEERALSAETSARADLLDFQLTRWFSDAFRAGDPAECARIAEVFLATPAAVHAASARALGGFDVADRLGEISAPTLVLVGEEDYATPPAMAEALAAGIDGATVTVLPATRHFSLVQNRDAWRLVEAHVAAPVVR